MDLENHEFEEEKQAFLPQSRADEHGSSSPIESRGARKPVTWYLRLLFELVMASTIVFLLFFRPSSTRGSLRRSPVPQRMSGPALQATRNLFRIVFLMSCSAAEDVHFPQRPEIHARGHVPQRVFDPPYSPQLDRIELRYSLLSVQCTRVYC